MLKVIEVALAEVGYHEGANNYNKYASDLDKWYGWSLQNQPWCDVYVDHCFVEAYGLELASKLLCEPIGGASASCAISMKHFQDAGRFSFDSPQVGDQVFFGPGGSSHTGLVIAVNGNNFETIEGNTSDQVLRRSHSVGDGYTYGFGHPDYSLVDSLVEVIRPSKLSGVDISNHQEGLTIQQLKNAGVDFVIMKATEGDYYVDRVFADFYQQAQNLGVPVGAYCYSHALTVEQAKAEAALFLKTLNGLKMPCGVYLDIEESSMLALSKDKLLDVIRAWCSAVVSAGYVAGLYGSEGNLWAKVSQSDLPSGTLVWVAKWSNTKPNIQYDIWQTSDSGRIAGFSDNLDTDVSMSDRFISLVYGETDSSSASNLDDSVLYTVVCLAPELHKGDVGYYVQVMQMLLALKGYAPENTIKKNGIADGEFGSGTEKALNNFKAAKNLPSDGVCDSQTFAELFNK